MRVGLQQDDILECVISNLKVYERQVVVDIVREYLSLLHAALADGQTVTIRGLGRFQVRLKKGRMYRSSLPGMKGKEVKVGDRYVVRFVSSLRLKQSLKSISPADGDDDDNGYLFGEEK